MTLIVKYVIIPFMFIISMFFIGNGLGFISYLLGQRFKSNDTNFEKKKCQQYQAKLLKQFSLVLVCLVMIGIQLRRINVGQTVFMKNQKQNVTEICVFMWERPLTPYTRTINDKEQIGDVMALLGQYDARKSLIRSHGSKASPLMKGHVFRLWYRDDQGLSSNTVDVWSTGLISFGSNGDVYKLVDSRDNDLYNELVALVSNALLNRHKNYNPDSLTLNNPPSITSSLETYGLILSSVPGFPLTLALSKEDEDKGLSYYWSTDQGQLINWVNSSIVPVDSTLPTNLKTVY